MSVWYVILIMAGLGGIGGFANCLITGEFVFPTWHKSKKIWRPGWGGNVLIGVVAAVVVGVIYGPLGDYQLGSKAPVPLLKMSQLFGAVLVGLGGGNILTQLAQKQSERIAKDNLAASLAALLSAQGNLTPAPPRSGVAIPPLDNPKK